MMLANSKMSEGMEDDDDGWLAKLSLQVVANPLVLLVSAGNHFYFSLPDISVWLAKHSETAAVSVQERPKTHLRAMSENALEKYHHHHHHYHHHITVIIFIIIIVIIVEIVNITNNIRIDKNITIRNRTIVIFVTMIIIITRGRDRCRQVVQGTFQIVESVLPSQVGLSYNDGDNVLSEVIL